ncbi:MAG: aminotransferase class V-fold PLP-dependent enzyme [Phycisphaerales bacterium]
MKPLPALSPLADRWAIDPGVVYLNHGSFGACPREALDAQSAYRARMEREAVRFFVQDYDALIDVSRAALAAFVRASPQDVVFVPNATTGVATALANLEPTLRPGDEILANDHEYPGCMANVRRTAARTGATVVSVPLPFPVKGPEQIEELILSRVTARTRVALLSHITSPTALVLPVERLVPELERRGVTVILDGAHALGQVPGLDVPRLGASYYTANGHKWLCAAKGAALLWVRPDRQEGFRPLVLSNFADRPKPGRKHLLTEFDYLGTGDATPYMTVGDAIRVVGAMVSGGWDEVIRRNHALARHGRDVLCRALGVEPPAPDAMLGSMASIPLPAAASPRPAAPYHDALQLGLIERHRIQVPVWSGGGRRLFRISAQLYNAIGQYEYLAGALREELDRERAG